MSVGIDSLPGVDRLSEDDMCMIEAIFGSIHLDCLSPTDEEILNVKRTPLRRYRQKESSLKTSNTDWNKFKSYLG